MSSHYVRDLEDAIQAIKYIFTDELEEALTSKNEEIEKLQEDLEDAQAEIEELREYKIMYEDLCQ